MEGDVSQTNKGKAEGRKSPGFACSGMWPTAIYGDFLRKGGWLLAPAGSFSNLSLMSDICQHSVRTIGNQGHSQFVLDLFKSSHPYWLLKRKGEKSYKVSLATVRIAKKRKENKTALTKETCSQDASLSKAPFIHLFPQIFIEHNCVPSRAVRTGDTLLMLTWARCSLSCSTFFPQTKYSSLGLNPLPPLLRCSLSPEIRVYRLYLTHA